MSFVNDFADNNFFDDNTINGTNESDIIVADYGDDEVFGLLGDDDIYGNIGNDELDGGGGNDELYGANGNDLLDGGEGNDLLDGGEGNDLLVSSTFGGFFEVGLGDTLTGGKHIDIFDVQESGSDLVVNNNIGSTLDIVDNGDVIEGVFDTITDYQIGETIRANVSMQLNVVGLDDFSLGHQHLELSEGEYAVIKGQSSGSGLFTVGAAGTDAIVVFDTLDGVDEPFIQGAVVVLNADPNMIDVI